MSLSSSVFGFELTYKTTGLELYKITDFLSKKIFFCGRFFDPKTFFSFYILKFIFEENKIQKSYSVKLLKSCPNLFCNYPQLLKKLAKQTKISSSKWKGPLQILTNIQIHTHTHTNKYSEKLRLRHSNKQIHFSLKCTLPVVEIRPWCRCLCRQMCVCVWVLVKSLSEEAKNL